MTLCACWTHYFLFYIFYIFYGSSIMHKVTVKQCSPSAILLLLVPGQDNNKRDRNLNPGTNCKKKRMARSCPLSGLIRTAPQRPHQVVNVNSCADHESRYRTTHKHAAISLSFSFSYISMAAYVCVWHLMDRTRNIFVWEHFSSRRLVAWATGSCPLKCSITNICSFEIESTYGLNFPHSWIA